MFSILTPVHDTDPQALRECWQSVRAQVYPHWQWCVCDDGSTLPETLLVLQEIEAIGDPRIRLTRLPASRHISVATNTALTLATGTSSPCWTTTIPSRPRRCWRWRVICASTRPTIWSTRTRTSWTRSDSAANPLQARLVTGPAARLDVSVPSDCDRRSLLDALGGMRVGFEGAQDYDLWLRASERTQAIGHVPEVLYHWRKSSTSTASSTFIKPEGLARSRRALEEHLERRGVDGRVEPGARPGLWRVR